MFAFAKNLAVQRTKKLQSKKEKKIHPIKDRNLLGFNRPTEYSAEKQVKQILKFKSMTRFAKQKCLSNHQPLHGDKVLCKYRNGQCWPGITVPTACIPGFMLESQTGPHQVCVLFFGLFTYGWVAQSHIYRYEKGAGEFKSAQDKVKLKAAMDEAEKWIDRFKDIDEMKAKFGNLSSKPPPYTKIKTNRVLAKFQEFEYDECTCRPDDLAACSVESGCLNVIAHSECHPNLCPAKVSTSFFVRLFLNLFVKLLVLHSLHRINVKIKTSIAANHLHSKSN